MNSASGVIREMKTMDIMKCHFTLIKMAIMVIVIIIVEQEQVLMRMWRHWNPYTFLWEYKMMWAQGESLAFPQKVKHKIII